VKAVLDTSILFQALYSSRGASHELLQQVRSGDLQIPVSIPVFNEYCAVLLRADSLGQFGLTKTEVQNVLDFIALVGIKADVHSLLRPNLRDESDNMFMELAFASNTKCIVSRNVRDFDTVMGKVQSRDVEAWDKY